MDTGIYCTQPNIYGIRFITFEDNAILYEKTHRQPFNREMMNEARSFYQNMKRNVKIQIYRKCKSIDEGEDEFMIWWSISHMGFLTKYCGLSEDEI